MNEKLSVAQYAKAAKVSIRTAYTDSDLDNCRIPGSWTQEGKRKFFRPAEPAGSDSDNTAAAAAALDETEQQFTVRHRSGSRTDDTGIEKVSLRELQDEVNSSYNSEYSDDDSDDDEIDDSDDDSEFIRVSHLVKAANLDPELENVVERAGVNDFEIPGGKIAVAAVAVIAYAVPRIRSYLNQRKAQKRENYTVKDNGSDNSGSEISGDNARQQSGTILKMAGGLPSYQ